MEQKNVNKFPAKYFLYFILLIIAFLIFLFFYPIFYSGKSIQGKIIDSSDKSGIKGAVVVAVWQLKKASGLWMNPSDILHMDVATTSKNGEFYIEEWGPKWRPIGQTFKYDDPILIVLKSGYEYKTLNNREKVNGSFSSRRDSIWNKKTIPITIDTKPAIPSLLYLRTIQNSFLSDIYFNKEVVCKRNDFVVIVEELEKIRITTEKRLPEKTEISIIPLSQYTRTWNKCK